jgi:hypothetical protein
MMMFTAASVSAPTDVRHMALKQWVADIANRELTQHDEWFEKLSDRLPRQLSLKRTVLGLRLEATVQTSKLDTPIAGSQ